MLIGFVLLVICLASGMLFLGLCRAAQRADAAEEPREQQRVEIE
jgi:hypothetical protein